MLVLMLVGLALTLLRPLALRHRSASRRSRSDSSAGHSVASAWVGLRATHAKAQAAALYLFSFYVGSSVAGSVGGLFWAMVAMAGRRRFVAAMLVAALMAARIAARESNETSPI